MEDGTKYIVISNPNSVRGCNIDQMIIVDDYRWEIYNQQWQVIDEIKFRMLKSCVPDEFQIQEYEW